MKLNLHKQAAAQSIPSGGVDKPQLIKPIFKSQQLLLQKAIKAEEDAKNAPPEEQEQPDLAPLFDLQKTELENQFLKQQLKLKEMHHAIEKGMVPDEKGGENIKIEGPHPAELKAHKAQLQVQLLEHKLKLIEATQGAEGQKEQGPHPAELEAHKAKMETERAKHELALKETQMKHEKEMASGGDAQTKGLFSAQLKHIHSRIDGVHGKLLKSGGLEKWAISARPIPAGTPNPAATPKTTPPASTQPPSGTSAGSGSGGSSMPKITIPSVVPKSNPFAPSNSAPSFKFPSGKTQTAGAGAPISDNPKKMTSLTPGQPANLPGSQNPLGRANLPGTNAPVNSTAPGASNGAFNEQAGFSKNIGGPQQAAAVEAQTPSSFQGVPASMAAAAPQSPINAPAAPGSGPSLGASNTATPMPQAPAAGGQAAATGGQGQPAGKQPPAWFQQRQNAMSGGIKGAPSMGNSMGFNDLPASSPASVNKTVDATRASYQQQLDANPKVQAARQRAQNDPNTSTSAAGIAAAQQRTADYNTIRNGGTIQATGPHGEHYGTVSGSPMAAAIPGAGGQASKVNAPGGGFSAVASAEASLKSASHMLFVIIKEAVAPASPAAPPVPAPQPATAAGRANHAAAVAASQAAHGAPIKAPEVGPVEGALNTAVGGVEKARQWSMTKDPDFFTRGKQYGEAFAGPGGHKGIRSYLMGGVGNVQDAFKVIPNIIGNTGKAVVRGVTNDIPKAFDRAGQGIKDTVGGIGDTARTIGSAFNGGNDSLETLNKGLGRTLGGLENIAGGAKNVLGHGIATALNASLFTPAIGKGLLEPIFTYAGGNAIASALGAGDSRTPTPVSDQKAIASAPSPAPAVAANTAPAGPNPQANITHSNRATQGLPDYANSEGYFGANPYDPSHSTANVDWAQGLRYDNPFAQAAVQFAPAILGMMGVGGRVRPPQPAFGGGGDEGLLAGSGSPTDQYYSNIQALMNNPGYASFSPF